MPGVALGAVLCQLNDDGFEQPLSYYACVFNKSERHYSNTEREILAMYESLKHFRSYVYGGSCVVFTDHQAILSLLKTNNLSQRLAKWQYVLMGETDWKVHYIPGVKNVLADCLSHVPKYNTECVNAQVMSVVMRSQAK